MCVLLVYISIKSNVNTIFLLDCPFSLLLFSSWWNISQSVLCFRLHVHGKTMQDSSTAIERGRERENEKKIQQQSYQFTTGSMKTLTLRFKIFRFFLKWIENTPSVVVCSSTRVFLLLLFSLFFQDQWQCLI